MTEELSKSWGFFGCCGQGRIEGGMSDRREGRDDEDGQVQLKQRWGREAKVWSRLVEAGKFRVRVARE
jgi:hypothetical protein